MLPMALNHITLARSSAAQLVDLSEALGLGGIELRDDLAQPLFDGMPAAEFGAMMRDRGVALYSLAEVYGFNRNTTVTRAAVRALADQAQQAGAGGIALIPVIGDAPMDRADQRAMLKRSLVAIRPILEEIGVTGLIEPLGFETATLRFKEDAVAVLDDLQRPECFALIHDSFHHHLTGETRLFPELTRMVHISGVTAPGVAPSQMADAHRGLIDAKDRLGNIRQINELYAAGYRGPLSFEAFSPDVHTLEDPAAALSASISFITAQTVAPVAA